MSNKTAKKLRKQTRKMAQAYAKVGWQKAVERLAVHRGFLIILCIAEAAVIGWLIWRYVL